MSNILTAQTWLKDAFMEAEALPDGNHRDYSRAIYSGLIVMVVGNENKDEVASSTCKSHVLWLMNENKNKALELLLYSRSRPEQGKITETFLYTCQLSRDRMSHSRAQTVKKWSKR
jgi:hypothetical protein